MDIANLVIRVTNDGLTAAQRELRRLRDETSRNVDANKQLSDGFGELAKYSAIALGALGGAAFIATKKAMSFETAMAEVNKTVDFAASDGLANLKNQLLDLSKVIPLTFEELAAVAASGGQLGIAEKDLASFTETVSKMAIAFDMSADEAGDAMAKLANVFEIPISEIDKLGDAINTLSNNSPAKASEIVNAMSRVGGLAKQFGLTEDATAALTSTFIALGKPAEIAASAVNSMLITFSTLDMASKSQLIGFEKLGVNIDEFAQRVKVDGKAAIYEFLEAVNKLPQEDRIGVIAPIIGREFGDDVAALAGSMGLLDKQMALVGETADSTKIYIGSMETEFQKMAATSENATTLFKNRTDALTATLGEAFLPVVNDLLLQIAPVIDKITVWAQANPELIRQITLVTASVLGSIVSLKLFADGMAMAVTTAQNLKTAFDLAKIGVLSLTSPIGIAITVALGLVAAGFLLYQNWDKVKQVVKDNEVAFALAAIAIGSVTSAILVAKAPMIFAAAQSWAMAAGATAWAGAATIASGATWAFNAALAVLTSPITLVVAAIGLIAYMGYQVVKNWAAIRQGLLSEFGRISGAVNTAVATMQAAWDRGVANTRAAFINIGNTISTTLKALPAKMMQVGREIVSGLINGIKSGASGVASAIGSMASGAVAKAKSVLDIRSPSRVMKKVGEQTAEGMANGIKKGAKVVKTEAQRMAEGAIKSIKDGIAGLKKELALFGNDSKLAAFNYDVSVGTFNGASSQDINQTRSLLSQIEDVKAEADAKTKLAAANKSVQDSIDGLVKQQTLFGNSSSLASLMYDIENTDKYKDATKELTDNLIEQTRALEQLGMTAKATEAIRSRFAKLQTDREASRKAVDGVMTELVNESPMAKIEADYKRRLDIIAENEMLETGIIGAEVDKRKAIEQSYMDAKRDLLLSGNEKLFGSLASIAKGFAGEQSGIYRAMFAIEKGFALARVLLASKTALALAWASAPFPANLGAVAIAAAETGVIQAAVGAINPKGFKQGGYTGNMGASQVAGVVHGQEYVFDAQATKRIGVDNLNAMRSGKAPAGGDVNITVNNMSSAKVETQKDDNGNIVMTIRDEIKRSWTNTGNPNSFESKQLNRNLQAPRRR